jgi:hypothetical protein
VDARVAPDAPLGIGNDADAPEQREAIFLNREPAENLWSAALC